MNATAEDTLRIQGSRVRYLVLIQLEELKKKRERKANNCNRNEIPRPSGGRETEQVNKKKTFTLNGSWKAIAMISTIFFSFGCWKIVPITKKNIFFFWKYCRYKAENPNGKEMGVGKRFVKEVALFNDWLFCRKSIVCS